jgi:transposase
MKDTELFQLALSLMPPWMVKDCTFDVSEKRLDIQIDFERGGTFSCPACGKADCGAYDTEERTWRHLNFFEHVTYLHAWVPRVRCPDCGVKTAGVPWARPGSGFTLLFEAFVVLMAREMPVLAVARIVGEHDTRIWRLVGYHVEEARSREDFSGVREVGVDETGAKRGHDYISLFVEMGRTKLLFATEGKDAGTIREFKRDFKRHGGKPKKVREVSMDMSKAFIAGMQTNFPKAAITFDRFHAVKLVGKALDDTRKVEQKGRPELKKGRYALLKNPENLTDEQAERLIAIMSVSNLQTARAYRIKRAFQALYEQPWQYAETYLKRWYFWATHSRIPAMIKAAHTVRDHWDGILRWFQSGITNAALEGINSLIQAAKARARGYRTAQNFITMAYLIAGKLTFNLPT